MKKIFLVSILVSILCVSCMTNEEYLDNIKRESIINFLDEYRHECKYEQDNIYWYKSEDKWRELQNRFADTMTKSITYEKNAGFKISKVDYEKRPSVLMCKTIANYVSSDGSGEFGEFRKYLIVTSYNIESDVHIKIGYSLVTPVPSSVIDKDYPYLEDADTCIEMSSSKFEKIKMYKSDLYYLGEFFIYKKNRFKTDMEEKMSKSDSIEMEYTSPSDTMIVEKDSSFFSKDEICQNPDKYPTFVGGTVALKKFIKSNLEYPPLARQYNISGTVIVSVIVEKDGTISGTKVLQDIGAGCGDAAEQVINIMPKWNPGTKNGKPVRCLKEISVIFEN